MLIIPNYDKLMEYINSREKEQVLPDSSELRKQLEALKSKYADPSATFPEAGLPVYEKKQTNSATDKELEDLAKSKLEGSYVSGKTAIENEAVTKAGQYIKNKTAADEAKNAAIKEIESAYDSAKQNAQKDSLRRGLARSSVASLQQQKLSDGELEGRTSIINEHMSTINAIDAKINELDASIKQALAEHDIKHAANTAIEADKLKKERDSYNESVLEYNNKLSQQEQKDILEQLQAKQDYILKEYQIKDIEKKHETYTPTEQFEEIYKLMVGSLSAMTKEQAKFALENDPVYTDYLNEYYLQKLKNYVELKK